MLEVFRDDGGMAAFTLITPFDYFLSFSVPIFSRDHFYVFCRFHECYTNGFPPKLCVSIIARVVHRHSGLPVIFPGGDNASRGFILLFCVLELKRVAVTDILVVHGMNSD